jgi:ribosome production factor 1
VKNEVRPKLNHEQEIGPRFTLKLKSMQSGTFDSSRAEYEWIHRKENEESKRRFFL